MTTKNSNMEIVINGITRDTEKAYLVNISVVWNEGKWHQKDIWFPKSQVLGFRPDGDAQWMEVTAWIGEQKRVENAFHGYRMDYAVFSYVTK